MSVLGETMVDHVGVLALLRDIRVRWALSTYYGWLAWDEPAEQGSQGCHCWRLRRIRVYRLMAGHDIRPAYGADLSIGLKGARRTERGRGRLHRTCEERIRLVQLRVSMQTGAHL